MPPAVGRFERQPPDFAGAPVITRAPAGAPSREARLAARLATLEQELDHERAERVRLGAELTLERRRSQQLQAQLQEVPPAAGQEQPDAGHEQPVQANDQLELELKRAWAQIHALNATLSGRRRRWWKRG